MPAFNSIPNNIRIPFMAVEFDSSRAQQGPSLLSYKALIIGQKSASGTWTANQFYRVTNVNQVIAGAGRGSMLHRQYLAWSAVNNSTECWIGVLADDGAGVAASGTILVTGTATAAGTIPLYMGGEPVPVSVALGDTAAGIATKIAAAINANLDLPLGTATVSTATVTVPFKHKGVVGNAYDMSAVYADGEAMPPGVSLTFTAMASGTTNPVLTTLIANMANLWFHIWTHPYTDATSLTAIETELARRNGPMVQYQGFAITSMTGNFAAHTSLGGGRNSQHSSIVAQPGPNPLTPPMEFAAEAAGLIAYYAAIDPAAPLQSLAFVRAKAPRETDQWSPDERNLFLFDGISTTIRVAGGGVQFNRAISTYQVSASGADDTAYLDATTVLTLLYLRYSFRNHIQLRHPRSKLANDDVKIAAGQKVITPKIGKAEAVAWFEDMAELLLVEGIDQFKRDLTCTRSLTDPNRLEWYLPPDLVNQFVVGAAQIGFRL